MSKPALLALLLVVIGCPEGPSAPAHPRVPGLVDADGIGVPDDHDGDVDGDGAKNGLDADMDGDGIANDEDDDADGDGTPNAADPWPRGGGDQLGPHGDVDGDGIPNATDPDDDGDGLPDGVAGNTAGEDGDGDGYCLDAESGYYPCDDGAPPGSGGSPDTDGDGITDPTDLDDDGDDVLDIDDTNPDGLDPPPPPEEPPEEPAEAPDEAADPPPAPMDPPPDPPPPACVPAEEVADNGIDEDCDGFDAQCPEPLQVAVDISGDCVQASCPAEAPYPVGCDIVMEGGDERGCVANTPGQSAVYFQEGDRCGSGHLSGILLCSSLQCAAAGSLVVLGDGNCSINKPEQLYAADPSGCPETDG